ncbi:MAG TPA: hypothetical protein VKD72_23130, partial [Gemmataceae bacterium]|nr:hypothetical protein [Gemmataceae bacterium]
MASLTWIRRLFARTPRRVAEGSRTEPARFRPRLETLEDRLVPAFITVDTLADNTHPVDRGHAGTAADPYQAPSLRSAISLANQLFVSDGSRLVRVSSTITIPSSLYLNGNNLLTGIRHSTISLHGSQLPTIVCPLTIVGDTTEVPFRGVPVWFVSGGGHSRVFDVGPTGSLSLRNLILENGATPHDGGAILNQGHLNLDHVTVTKSRAHNGGGIASLADSVVTITHSTISANTATGSGGGLWSAASSRRLEIDHSTITHNKAAVRGGGVATSAFRALFSGDTISHNSVIGPNNSTVSGFAHP